MRLNRLLLAAAVLWTAAASCPAKAYGHGGAYRHDPPPEKDERDPGADVPQPATIGCGNPGSPRDLTDDWDRWWAHNRDELIVIRVPVGCCAGRSGVRITNDTVATVIVPLLRARLADADESFHVRSAAAIALARIGDTASAATLRELAENKGRAHHREVEETAALALGLLPEDPRTRAFLLERMLTREPWRGSFRRQFAAIALALLGGSETDRRAASRALLDAVACEKTDSGVRPACLLALGLLGEPSSIPEIADMAGADREAARAMKPRSGVERAFAVEALGRIGSAHPDPTALRTVTALVEGRREEVGVDAGRSAVIALGRIASRGDARTQRAAATTLRAVVRSDEGDLVERHFALTSLGRIAASHDAEPQLRAEIAAALRTAMDKNERGDTPFAAIALGLVGRAMADKGLTPQDDVSAPLRQRALRETDTRVRGALAVAAGLARDPFAVPGLLTVIADPGESGIRRASSALALGMIGDVSACESLRNALRDDLHRELRMEAAIALGLLGDARVVDDLVKRLVDPEASNYELGSAALALGRIGDERAVAPLVGIATDTQKRHADLTRAFAVVALGLLADRREVPAFARIATDVNYLARDPAITELLTIL